MPRAVSDADGDTRALLMHFHVQDTMIMVDNGNLLHPQCTHYAMLVPWVALSGRHPKTSQCANGEEQKRSSLEEEEVMASTEWDFQTYGRLLTLVS